MEKGKTIATIGMFDGVHLGHRYLLSRLEEESLKRKSQAVVITFTDHPLGIIAPGKEPARITPPHEKRSLLAVHGDIGIIELEFDESLRNLSAREFLSMIHDKFGVSTLLMGYDHHFGHDRIKDRAVYSEIGKAVGVEIVFSDPLIVQGQPVCSSLIRKLISEGEVGKANDALGRPYSFTAKVVGGKRIGRTIGFPTANLCPLDSKQLMPASGVYAVKAAMSDGSEYGGMLNIGIRPTVDHSPTPATTVEVNLFDCTRDLYGAELTVSFIERMRGECKFDSLEALKNQLDNDRRQAMAILESQA